MTDQELFDLNAMAARVINRRYQRLERWVGHLLGLGGSLKTVEESLDLYRDLRG